MRVFQHHHTGKRQYQEDAIGKNSCVYLVCDGLGGHGNGELAAQTVLQFVLQKSQNKALQNESQLSELIQEANTKLNSVLEENCGKEGMGTTLAGVFKINGQWFSAHIGDSRVYVVRPKARKFWHTWDHSFVSQLVKLGEITREAARKHPRSNEIQKAILANSKGKCVKPEIHFLNSIEPGDVVLICSDGVNEAWSDYDLLKLLSNSNLSSNEKARHLFQVCEASASDNNTAFLLEFEEFDLDFESVVHSKLAWSSIDDLVLTEKVSKEKAKKFWWKYFFKK